jgi:thiol-disulfide isomerase/thioredoxin
MRRFALPLLLAFALTAPRAASADLLKVTAPEAVALGQITLTDGSKASVPLESVLPDGPAILHFWATWCAPCREELPHLDAFTKDLVADGLAEHLVVISVDRARYDRVAAFLDYALGLDLISWQDESRKAGTVFRLFGYPATILLDAEHRVVWRHAGSLEWDNPVFGDALTNHLTASR